MIQTSVNKETQEIINALYKKNKREFKWMGKALEKQVLSFAPAYRDFILKIIKSGSIRIHSSRDDGYIITEESDTKSKKLSKRAKSYVVADIREVDILPHELGHAVDFWFGRDKALSSNVIIKDNKTLYDIFVEEFYPKSTDIYNMVMDEYENIINSNINNNAYEIIMSNIDYYNYLSAIPVDLRNKETTKMRRDIQNRLYRLGFVETYYQLVFKKCNSILNTKYLPILDALSSTFNLKGLCLAHHDLNYYLADEKRVAQEFFANLFAAKVTSKHYHFENLIKLLPQSFDAFEKLFFMFYDHIQNGKRFTDIELKKE